mgnify:FL=1
MKNKITNLLSRASKICCSRGITSLEIQKIQNVLDVVFPNDFLDISYNYHFEYLDCFDWSGISTGTIEYTQILRQEGLPNRFIILAGFRDDAGSVFMETQDNPEKPSPVYWCDMEDVYNLCEEGVFKYNPTVWPSFTDFFEYLVNEEEKRQREELEG